MRLKHISLRGQLLESEKLHREVTEHLDMSSAVYRGYNASISNELQKNIADLRSELYSLEPNLKTSQIQLQIKHKSNGIYNTI